MTTPLLDHKPPATTATDPVLTLVPLTHPLLRRAVRHFGDQQELHRTVMGLFATDLPGDAGRRRATAGVLHRLDTPSRQAPRLLVQHTSPLRPDLAPDSALRHATLRPMLDRLATGVPVSFRVVLNAVRVQTRTGKRLAVTDPDDLITWGIQRLTTAGLTHIGLADRPATALTRAHGPLWTAQYDGRARIDDPDATLSALINGMGRARAYGCGLLSLAPLGD